MTSMPYNTRRKSLPLAELGVIVPNRARAQSQSQPISPNTTTPDEPTNKKQKRSADSKSPSPGSMSPPRTTNIHVKTEARVKFEPPSRLAEHTPPPSPGASDVSKIDIEGINDDVVVGTIKQLESTGNRPHLVKELAAVLCNSIGAVEKSANPANLISSRLTSYLNPSWPTISPCPIGKYQSTIHPRPLYYFLTTQPHQPISEMNPANAIIPVRRIISPSLSSAADQEEAEDKYKRSRDQLSPSPEVDLSSPELDEAAITEMSSSFTGRDSIPRDHPPTTSNLAHNRRADSPPLEREEQDFKQTANQLQEQRRTSRDSISSEPKSIKSEDSDSIAMSIEDEIVAPAEDNEERRNSEAAAMLFGSHGSLSTSVSTIYDISSPVLKPENLPQIDTKTSQGMMLASAWHNGTKRDLDAMSVDADKEDDTMDLWSDLRSPENIELDELECLLDAY